MKRWIFLIFLGIGGALLFRTFAFEGIYIASESMEHLLKVNDHFFVNKVKPLYQGYKRGDVVLFHAPQAPEKEYVKRIIAVGGDTIEIKKKAVYLNGEKLIEPYVQYLRPNVILQGDNSVPIYIPKNNFFLMGDNRDFSKDSRDWTGPDGEWLPYISKSSMKGILPIR